MSNLSHPATRLELILRTAKLRKNETRPGRNAPPDSADHKLMLEVALEAFFKAMRAEPDDKKRGEKIEHNARYIVRLANELAGQGALDDDETAGLICGILSYVGDAPFLKLGSDERKAIATAWENHARIVSARNQKAGKDIIDETVKAKWGRDYVRGRARFLQMMMPG